VPPPSVDRPIFLFRAWFHHEMKSNCFSMVTNDGGSAEVL